MVCTGPSLFGWDAATWDRAIMWAKSAGLSIVPDDHDLFEPSKWRSELRMEWTRRGGPPSGPTGFLEVS